MLSVSKKKKIIPDLIWVTDLAHLHPFICCKVRQRCTLNTKASSKGQSHVHEDDRTHLSVQYHIPQHPKSSVVTHLYECQQQCDILRLLNEDLCELTPQVITLFWRVLLCNHQQCITTHN